MKLSILNLLLRDFSLAQSFSSQQWDLCIRQAQSASLLGRLHYLLEIGDIVQYLPPRALNHLKAARMKSDRQHKDIAAEANLLSTQLNEKGLQITYLKGAAYVLSGIASQGRTCSDIDILVSKSQLPDIEQKLQNHGWAPEALDDYDKKYYRQWMHEIPPMIHLARQTVLDVHHNIVPLTNDRLPKANKLLESRCPTTSSTDGLKHFVLSPVDMILHSAVHLFSEGELDKGLRDLTDLELLFSHYFSLPTSTSALINELFTRARSLNLEEDLILALRYCDKVLATSLPIQCRERAENYATEFATTRFKFTILDFCYSHSFVPFHSSCKGYRFELASLILFIRSHIKKMPLRLLLPHLSIKWWSRTKKLFIAT